MISDPRWKMTVPGRPHLVTTPTARGHVVGVLAVTFTRPRANTGSAGGQYVLNGTSFVPELLAGRLSTLKNAPDHGLQVIGQTRFVERQIRTRLEDGLVHVVAYAG